MMPMDAKLLFLLLSVSLVAAENGAFKTLYSWNQLDFNFPDDAVRQRYIASGDYIQGNSVPIAMSIWKNKLFLTVPRWKRGVPANLNYITLNETEGILSPKLTPYPDLEANDIHSYPNSSIVSIFRITIDSCNRLWGVDSGLDDILGEGNYVAPVQLVIIDLDNDKIIRRYTLKDSDQKSSSFFGNLVIDVDPNSCNDAYAYISDFGSYGLVVYNFADNDSWRVNHNYFYFDPLNGDYNVNGINFQWTDGVFGLALSPRQNDGERILYFHAMSGITEFAVSTAVLKNESLATSSDNYYFFHEAGNKGPLTQGSTVMLDEKTGIMYFNLVNKNGVACWDTRVKLDPASLRLIAEDAETLLFPNDLVIDSSATSRKLYVLSNNLPKFQYTDEKPTKNEYVISVANLDSLTPACSAGASQTLSPVAVSGSGRDETSVPRGS